MEDEMETRETMQGRPDAVVSAARDNAREDALALARALTARVKPLLTLAQELSKDEGRRPTVDEVSRALFAATHESADEREAALDLAADMRLAGVSVRETARQWGGAEKSLSAALTARPLAGVRLKTDLLWDEGSGRWRSRKG